MTGPQDNDDKNKTAPTAVPETQDNPSPIADDAGKPNPEPAEPDSKKGHGPKNQSRLKPARPLRERLPSLIAIGVVLGLIVAAGIVMAYRAGWFTKEAPQAELVTDQAKGPLAALATGAMAKLITYETPQKVDDISFANREREMVNLSAFKGQVVVLNVWATWCAPCRYEMPTLAALQTRYAGQDVKVIALSIDTEDKFPDVVSFMDVQQPLEVYTDTRFAAPSKFKVQGMPATFILNKKGEMVARLDGEADWNTPEVHALLDALVKE